jgi:hypothetical protein
MKDFCEHLFIEIVTIQIILTMSTNVIKKMTGKGWNKDKPFNLIFLFTTHALQVYSLNGHIQSFHQICLGGEGAGLLEIQFGGQIGL